MWLGLNDLTSQGLYTWSDGHKVTFTNWARGQPDSPTERCVRMMHKVRRTRQRDCFKSTFCSAFRNICSIFAFLQTGKWEDTVCAELNAVTCTTALGHYPPVPVDPPTKLTCPPVGEHRQSRVGTKRQRHSGPCSASDHIELLSSCLFF